MLKLKEEFPVTHFVFLRAFINLQKDRLFCHFFPLPFQFMPEKGPNCKISGPCSSEPGVFSANQNTVRKPGVQELLPCHFDPFAGTEELGHLEMIGAIVHQLTRDLSMEQIKKAGFDAYFVDHTTGVYPTAASGFPWSAASMAVKGDVITDLTENMAAEQKARTTYDNILRLSDDPDVNDVIRFLREREIVHYQRFGEGLRRAIEKMDQKNFYAINPAFDRS